MSDELRDALGRHELAPLWEAIDRNAAPRPATVPHRWAWADVEPLLRQAGEAVSADDAERRVLMLVNPASRGEKRAVGNLYGGVQLVLPGERAPAHRHTAAALRFILQGRGASTVVDGEEVDLEPLDLVLTPAWTWHDHVNAGAEPMAWLDGLDSPLTRALDAWFFEPHPDRFQVAIPRAAPEGGTAAATGAGPPGRTLRFPWAAIRSALGDAVAASSDGSAFVAYTDPITGGDVFPTIRCGTIGVAAGARRGPGQRVGASMLCVAEGAGQATVGEATYPLRFGDVVCVPSWAPLTLEADADADLVLFTYDDEPVLRALGLARSIEPR